MNYAVEQRMRFIDFLLYKYGYINRTTICDFFGIGESTATRDFAKYKSLNPYNMVLDDKSKNYIKTPEFDRAYT